MSLLTEKELSEILNVSRITLNRFRGMGMPYIRLGCKLIRYDYNDIVLWLQQNKNIECGKEVN